MNHDRTQTGLVAGDEECVDTFKDIFLAVHRQLQPQPFELPSISTEDRPSRHDIIWLYSCANSHTLVQLVLVTSDASTMVCSGQRLDIQLPCKWVKIEMRRNISGIRRAGCESESRSLSVWSWARTV